MAPSSSGDGDIETGTSASDRSPPESVQRDLDRRRAAWLDQTKRRAAIDDALAYTEDEREEIDEAFREIAEQFGILDEIEDIQEAFRGPRERYLNLLDESDDGKQGGKR